MSFWRGRHVLVTGGTGFIGSNLVESLLGLDAYVVVADHAISEHVPADLWKKRLDRYLSICKKHGVKPNLEIIDLTVEREKLVHIITKHELQTVFMLSAVFGGRGFVDLQQSECSYGFAIDQNTIRACQKSGIVERVCYASSACVYPSSLNKHDYLLKEDDVLSTGEGWQSSDNLYGFQKLTTELTLQAFHREYGLKTSSCRLLTVYGPGEYPSTHAISMLITRALHREDPFIVWGTGLAERGFTYVDDIVNGQILACEKITNGSAVNLGTDKRYSIKSVVETILKISGHTPKKIIYDRTKPEGPLSRALDISKAQQLLGWKPEVDLQEGLQRTVDWLRNEIGTVQVTVP